jgi:hypothetical protein
MRPAHDLIARSSAPREPATMLAMPRIPALCLASSLTLACAPPVDPADTSTASSNISTSDNGATAAATGTSDAHTDTSTSATTAIDTGESPACDTLLQDCPAGHKCTGVKPTLQGPYTGTACVPDNADGGSAPGSICINAADGSDTCGPDSMCVQFGSGEGACVAFCTPDALGCADPQQVCARTDTQWSLYLCVPPCDPLAYDCPDVDVGALAMVCAPATIGFGCQLRGHLGGLPFAAPCINHRDCSAAAHCAPPTHVPGCAGASGCCDVYCDISAPAPCPLAAEGQACVPYYAPGEAPPGREDVGVCAVP